MAESNRVAPTAQPRTTTPPRGRGASPTTKATPSREATGQLAQEIAERLWRRLPITSVEETGCRSMEQVIRAASASHRVLLSCREELTQLPELLSTVMLRFTGEEPSSALREKLAKRFQQEIQFPTASLPAPLSFLDAEFADLIPEIAVQHAKAKLKSHCLALVNALMAWLEQLQQKQLIGSVTHLDCSCRFTHAERQLQIVDQGARTFRQKRGGSVTTTPTRRTFVVDEFREQQFTVQSIHRTLIHEVHRPQLRGVDQCQSAIPETYRQFLDALPEWLAPSVRVLEGDLFNHRCVARDLSSETHRLSEIVRTVEQTEWLYDPGILLGDYVLAGWGEAEIAAEEAARAAQRQQTEREHSQRQAPRYFAAAGLVAALSAVVTWFSPVVAILVGVVAVLLASRGLEAGRHLTEDPHEVPRQTAVIGAFGFALLAALTGLLYASPVAMAVAAGLAVVAYLVRTLPPTAAQ